MTEAPRSTPEIRLERGETGGRYVMPRGDEEAELTFSIATPQLVSADHTRVPESFRGTGAALALVERLVADARAQGFKIVPECSYVEAQRRKHPDWADVFSGGNEG